MAQLVEKRAQHVHQLGALTDQPATRSKQHRSALLLDCLRLDEPHLRPLCRYHDRLGIGRVVLLALH